MFSTNDLATAAYLMVRGCKLKNAYINKAKIYCFEFIGSEDEIRQIAIEFINSECSRYDSQVKNLKKILRTCYT